MMPNASAWLKAAGKSKLQSVTIQCVDDSIIVKLSDSLDDLLEVEYERHGESTSVECKKLKEETVVWQNIVNVFYEDITEILMEQEHYFSDFYGPEPGQGCSLKWLESITDQVIRSFAELKLQKNRPFSLNCLTLYPISTKQAVSFIKLLDPEYLDGIVLESKGNYEMSDLTELLSLNSWNQNHYRKWITFSPSKLTLQNLIDTEELRNSTVFDEIAIVFNKGLLDLFPSFTVLTAGSVTKFLMNIPKKANNEINIGKSDPDPRIAVYSIRCSKNWISTEIITKSNDTKRVGYAEKREAFPENLHDCDIIKRKYASDFANNFKVELQNQSCPLEKLHFINANPGFFKDVGKVLKKQSIRVEWLALEKMDEEAIMKFLPYVEPKYIKIIKLDKTGKVPGLKLKDFLRGIQIFKRPNIRIPHTDVSGISGSEHWLNTKELIVENTIITTPLDQIKVFTFANVDIIIRSISSQDIYDLKEKILKSSKLRRYKIVFKKSTVHGFLDDLLGAPYRSSNEVYIWYFHFPRSEESLQVGYVVHQAVFFTRVLTKDIDSGVKSQQYQF